MKCTILCFWFICHMHATKIPDVQTVCSGQVCNQAEECLTQLTTLSSDTTCLERLKSVVTYRDCINANIDDCSDTKKTTIQESLQQSVTIYLEECSGGCSDILTKYKTLTETCIVSDEHMVIYLNTAARGWNANNSTNETITRELRRIVGCIEDVAAGCTIIREAYGQLYQTYVKLPLVEQIFGTYKQVNGIHESSPIIQDCPGLVWKDELKNIINTCYMNHSTSIIDYCATMQIQINCALGWQLKCPVAVTKFLGIFMDSYGVVHTIFCSNISVNDFEIRSLAPTCVSDTYRRTYTECWRPIVSHLEVGENDHSALTPDSLGTILRLQTYRRTDGNLCLVFADTKRYNTTLMRECTKGLDDQCPLLFPTHGELYPIPSGLLYDEFLYNMASAGPLPFNEYGIVVMQYIRDHLCYTACDDYDSSNTDFIDECQNKIRAIALELETEKTPDKCDAMKNKITCISNTSQACPLFQYQAENLLDEPRVSASLTMCEIMRPPILPEEYTIKTTTLAAPSTTSYWSAVATETPQPFSSTTANRTETSDASSISRLSTLTVIIFMLSIQLHKTLLL